MLREREREFYLYNQNLKHTVNSIKSFCLSKEEEEEEL